MASEEWSYRFGDIEVEPAAHQIRRGGVELGVEPKAFAVLVALLEQHGRALERDALLDRVWGHRHVTPGVLNRVVAQLRKALGDDAEHPRYIQTVHSLGYRFIGEVERRPAVPPEERGIAPSGPLVADTVPVVSEVAQPHWRLRHFAMVSALAVAALVLGWAWQRQDATRPQASIAVLPFTSLSSNRGEDYFAEGLAVEMHDALAAVPGLVVAAQVFPESADLRGGDPKTIGQRLGVATILDASVRREGARVRITARLSDCSTGYTLWSHSYDRKLSDVFATQSEIAAEVVKSLVGVLPGQDQRLARRLTPTRNVAAFDAYLKGLQQLRLSVRDGQPGQAVGHFRRALEADRGFARAQAGICQSELSTFERLRNADAYARARAACLRAQQMDPGLSEVQLALGELHHARAEYGLAIDYYTRAAADPVHASAAHVGIAMTYAAQGRQALALEHFQRALELRPGDAKIHAQIGYQQYLAGNLAPAIGSYRTAVTLSPGDAEMWSTLGGLHFLAGDDRAAAQAFERSIRIKPTDAVLSNYGTLELQQGRYAAAAALYRRALALDDSDFFIWGNLGDALFADPRTAGQSRAPFQRAAAMAERYVAIKPDDAQALAALGWYRAALGQRAQARELAARSEALQGRDGEVALFNAQTLVIVGSEDEVRARVAAARAAGIPERSIAANVFLRTRPAADQAPKRAASQ